MADTMSSSFEQLSEAMAEAVAAAAGSVVAVHTGCSRSSGFPGATG